MFYLFLVIPVNLALASAQKYFASQKPLNFAGNTLGLSSSCPFDSPVSCHNSTAERNLCCFEAPGGLLLQTQFWDTAPPTGPSDSWTIHGLWPDKCVTYSPQIARRLIRSGRRSPSCDTSFEQNCDPSRAYTNIPSLLTEDRADDVLEFIKQAVAFFKTVVTLFKSLPTYEWLSSQGILPSSSQTFTLDALTGALTSASGGFAPQLDCRGHNLEQISWYFNVKGSIIDGVFLPIDTPKKGSCPSTGIKYLPKQKSPRSPSPTKPNPSPPRPTSGDLPTRATIEALPVRSNATLGGLLSAGTWSVQTLAAFSLSGTPSNFMLSSSKGDCGVSNGAFSCGSRVVGTPFSAVSNNNVGILFESTPDTDRVHQISSSGHLLLASGGSTAWTSDTAPSRTDAVKVFTGSSRDADFTLSIVEA
ncbi:ribonuclease T2-like [Pleurotus pulmonarius]|nr:ribonuclease T2-like [Pleurotus pulmonarius]